MVDEDMRNFITAERLLHTLN